MDRRTDQRTDTTSLKEMLSKNAQTRISRGSHLLAVPLSSEVIVVVEEVNFPSGGADVRMPVEKGEEGASAAFPDAHDDRIRQSLPAGRRSHRRPATVSHIMRQTRVVITRRRVDVS